MYVWLRFPRKKGRSPRSFMAKCFTCRSIVIAKEMHEDGGVHDNIGRDYNYRRFRVFAIGNYVNQRLLWPVHDWLAKVLQGLPVDLRST